MAKTKKQYTAWVRLNAVLGFKVHGDSPEDALSRAQTELKETHLIADGIDYMDGSERITGITEDD